MSDRPSFARSFAARYGSRFDALARTVVRRSKAPSLTRQLTSGPLPDPTEMLDALLAHAARSVPYWRERLDPQQDLVAQHARLPPLTKDDIRRDERALRSDDLDHRRWWVDHSGGSSGSPIAVVHDHVFADWRTATSAWYFEHHLGVVSDGVPKVLLWGSESDLFGQGATFAARLHNTLTQTVALNAFKMDATAMRRYADIIRRVRPLYIRGYAGSLFELARFVEGEGIRLYRPQFVCSAAETLNADMRAVIERAFGAPVYDFYGSREVGPLAGEGRDGLLHTFSFFNYVEVVDNAGQPVGPGGHGRVLVTTLRNYAMPLVRYDIGDTAEVATVDAAGSVETLGRVTGRVTEHFVAADGSIVHGEYFTHLFYGVDGVREFQVVQRKLDDVEILWAPATTSRPFAEVAVRDIEAKIRFVLGAACAIEWTCVDEVPLTPHGKRLFTRSLVHRTP